jgi:hypothetical protein
MNRLRPYPPLSTLVLVAIVVLAGCAQPVADNRGPGDDGSTGTVTQAEPETQGGSSPTATTATSSATGVTTASQFARVEVGETMRMFHAGRNVSLWYGHDGDTATVEVSIEAQTHTITRQRTASAETVSWSEAGRRFVVNPVEPDERDGQTVYLFGDTWNTSHVELEVYCMADCS